MLKGKKILVISLIFTLTFSYFSVVTEAIASNSFISLFSSNAEKWNENVEFTALLNNGEEENEEIVSDVNNDNLFINLQLGVKDSGYLKDAKVEIQSNEESELNFKIGENEISDNLEFVQSLEDNVLTYNKIENSDEELEVNIPIEYVQEEYIKPSKLCNNAKIIFSGVYVDEEGEENEIYKETELILAWKNDREFKVQNEVTKYIQFGDKGIILQTILKVNGIDGKENALPVKSTDLNVHVPSINNVYPSEVYVVANSNMGTTGKSLGETTFSNDNWNYNEEENKISIFLENELQTETNLDANSVILQDEAYVNQERQTQKYYSVQGIDEYVITYTYKDVEITEEIPVTTRVEGTVSMMSGVSMMKRVYDEAQTDVNISEDYEYILSDQTGNLVSFNTENDTSNVSKLYGYLNNGTEISFESKTSINVSYNEIIEQIIIEDEDNYYVDKSENKVLTDDMYYKRISVSKENFNEILGEDGRIEVLGADDQLLYVIDKNLEVDETDKYTVEFENKIGRIKLKTSRPIKVGNLIVFNERVVSNVSLAKAEYMNIDAIATRQTQTAKFDYVSEMVTLGSIETRTNLVDTTTSVNLSVDRTSLSTVTTNTNVEFNIQLNNDKIYSDLYGHSVFELEMPEHVKNLDITGYNIIYGEGLEISSVGSYKRDDGRSIVKVILDGIQTSVNSNILTNGTNIILTADLEVDKYTPSLTDSVKVYAYNSQVTNYDNVKTYTIEASETCSYQEAEISYVAPSGLISINTLSNFDENGSIITSIREGKVEREIPIYSSAKVATTEMIIINNNDYNISNMSVLGRFPFDGVKDIEVNEPLSSNINTRLMSTIISESDDFVIYYSENGEATSDLDNPENGWTQTPGNLETLKSYLIVPKDEKYEVASKAVLRFSYQFEIPENLEHNAYIYGTYLTTFKDENGEMGASKPSLVGLTTGVGPQVGFEARVDKTVVAALDQFDVVMNIENKGETIIENLNINMNLPKNTTYVSATANRENVETTFANNVITTNVEKLAKGGSFELVITLKANEISNYADNVVSIAAELTAKDLRKGISVETEKVTIQRSELRVEQSIDHGVPNRYFKKDEEITLFIEPKNLTDKTLNNVVVTTKLPNEIDYVDAYMKDGTKRTDNASFDESTKTVTWRIDSLEDYMMATLYLKVRIGDLAEGVTGETVKVESTVVADNTKTYNGEDMSVNIGRASVSVSQTSSTATYVESGKMIEYTFNVKNEGSIEAENVQLKDMVSEGLIIRSLEYTVNGQKSKTYVSADDDATVELTVPPKTELEVKVQAMPTNLGSVEELTVTNVGILTTDSKEEITSNPITHIVQNQGALISGGYGNGDDDEHDEDDEVGGISTSNGSNNNNNNNDYSGSNGTNNSNGGIIKSYKISGTAWLDKNENGKRDDDENRMSDITAMLINSNDGTIKETTTTNSKGEYVFSGLQNGSYMVLFKYNTRLYTTTAYHKEGVDSQFNSDVFTTQIEQNGRKENGAVTDSIVINELSMANMDIGLVESAQFNLKIDNSITKITVQNAQGTDTINYDNTKLAKYDIAAKYLSGTAVYIEYTVTVTNIGDLAGFASEIVDYLPAGMTFNSNLNPGWYTGSDGNLYTKALADVEIAKGESKSVKLVLTKQMTTENTGIVSNTIEIASDYNIYGVSDINSTPMNKSQSEDDTSTADAILTVKTGEVVVYSTALVICTVLGIAGGIIFIRLRKNQIEGGESDDE